MRIKKDVSLIEGEAKTAEERYIVEARERSASLVKYAVSLHSYLHGGEGGPNAAESAWKEADAIRYALNSALSGRLARLELERKEKEKKCRTKATKG